MPNCKPGDLAIFIKSPNGRNLGRIVRVVEQVQGDFVVVGGAAREITGNDGVIWKLDQDVWHRSRHTGQFDLAPYCRDGNLRPLRDNPGADETLAWTPVPKKEKA